MDDRAVSDAMTEIGLALAMAFFCLLVLVLISVGPPDGAPAAGPEAPRLQTAARWEGQGRPVGADERLVLFHGGRFLDRKGGAVDPAAVAGAVVLAVDPGLPLERVLAARAQFAGGVVVTPLDADWLNHLSRGVSK